MRATQEVHYIFQDYDYVIVGAGTCGCVLANRLSEDKSVCVLVIEAGLDDSEKPDIAIPGKAVGLLNTEFDWAYKSVPQKNTFKGYKDQISLTPRGKGLGGSSSINNLLYMRGTPHDYDIWENLGCTGWAYKDVLPYFQKSESCKTRHLAENGYHGRNGPMGVTEGGYSPMRDVFIDGGKELGYIQTDCNGADPIGFMVAQSNISEGIRQSSAECFLRPAHYRSNLHISTRSYVQKICVVQNTAYGVEFYKYQDRQSDGFDKLYVVRARREVLLCAGAISSPQILMLSGIGPKDHLLSKGIKVVADLPVGDNYQDHCGCLGLEFEINQPWSPSVDGDPNALYSRLRAGFLATNAVESMALIRSPTQDPENPNPDLALTSGTFLLGADPTQTWKKNVDMLDSVWEEIFGRKEDKNGFMIIPNVTHPKSRGTVRLATCSPKDHPLIDPRTFDHPDDLKKLVEGIKLVFKLTSTKAYLAVGTKFSERTLPGYTGTPYTDEYWEEYARTMVFNQYHCCGTCRMGRLREDTTVVDPQLRVKGIKKLRVVDASIIPVITSANLNATCVMIAEKAADMIKGDYSSGNN